MKNIKKILSICLVAVVFITLAITGFAIFGINKNPNNGANNQTIDWESYGIHFASAEEETGALTAPEHMKGGSITVSAGTKFVMQNAIVEYHEAYYGGAFYVEKGGVLEINSGVIRCNGAMWGGAIYVEYGGKVIINGGTIEYNNAENGPAIFCAPDPNATGDLGQNFEAIVLGNSVTLDTIVSKNEYADFGEFYINYYVDGDFVSYSEQKIAAFRNDETPITYEECNGWFFDPELTDPIEEGDVIQYTETGVQTFAATSGGTYHKVINLYTKSSTTGKFTFTDIDATTCKATATGSGDFVMPKTYNGKDVTTFDPNVNCSSFYINSNVKTIPAEAFANSSITAFNFVNTIQEIKSSAFEDCSLLSNITIPKGCVEIESYAFNGCVKITELTFASDALLTTIGDGAFSDLSMLEQVNYNSNNITTINEKPFANSGKETGFTLTLSDNVTAIPSGLINDESISVNLVLGKGFTSIPASQFASNPSVVSLFIPSSVKTIGNSAFLSNTKLKAITFDENCTLTTIEDKAFQNCFSLESFEIPTPVTSIGSYAFASSNINVSHLDSPWLKTIGDYAFQNNTGIIVTSGNFLHLGSGLISLGSYAFAGCTNIKGTISLIPCTSLTTINSRTFSGCTNLEGVYLPTNLTKINSYAFASCTALTELTFPASLTAVGGSGLDNNAFSGCSNLKTITYAEGTTVLNAMGLGSKLVGVTTINIPSTITEIAAGAFSSCYNIVQINMAEGCSPTKIGRIAFFGNKITSFTLPDSVTEIGEQAFQACSNMTEFNVSANSSLTKLSNNAFSGCSSLTYFFIPKNLTSFGVDAFSKTGIKTFEFADGIETVQFAHDGTRPTPTKVILPTSATSIATSAFANLTTLETVEIKNNGTSNIATIGNSAFLCCSKLSSLPALPSLTTIGYNAFYLCSSLTSFSLPDKVKIINESTFYGCSKLTEFVISENSTLEEIGLSAFYNCAQLTYFFIPKNLDTFGGSVFNKSGIKTFEFADGITSIKFNMSGSLPTPETIILPSSATSISSSAFSGLSSLKTVKIKNDAESNLQVINNYAFKGCSNLTTLPTMNKLGTIDIESFAYCTSLTSFALASSVAVISHGAFRESGLTSITIPTNSQLSYIGKYAFYKTAITEIALPSGLTEIGEYAFASTSLEYVAIPASVAILGTYAFSTTTLHTAVNLSNVGEKYFFHPEEYKSQGAYGYFGRYSDAIFTSEVVWTEETNNDSGITYRIYTPKTGTHLTFVDAEGNTVSLTRYKVAISVNDNTQMTYDLDSDTNGVGFDVFKGNGNLMSITLPENLYSIGNDAFNACYDLAVIFNLSNIPLTDVAGTTQQYGNLNYYVAAVYDTVYNITRSNSNGVDYLYVDNGYTLVDKIAMGVADGYISNSVNFDGDTTIIGYAAFRNNTTIDEITFYNSIRKIAYNAFRDCTNLTFIYNLEEVDNYGNAIETLPTSLTHLGAKAFQGTSIGNFESTSIDDDKWEYSEDGITWTAIDTSDMTAFTFMESYQGYYYRRNV